MGLSSYIARRYFFSRQSSNAVNILTGISVVGIWVGTAALIIVLSAFNGLEDLVRQFYGQFDPDLKISASRGKFFDPKAAQSTLTDLENLRGLSYSLEEKALFSFRDREYIASLKGVDSSFAKLSGVPQHLRYGDFVMGEDLPFTPVTLGAGVAYFLGFSAGDLQRPIQIFLPRPGGNSLAIQESFRQEKLYPTGVFAIQPEFDEKYVLAPLAWTQKLLEREGLVSAIEVYLQNPSESAKVQKHLRASLGPDLRVANRDEQQAAFFKVMKTEGLFSFLIFALILAIAVFTITGSLIMLMFEKRRELHSLWALGTEVASLRRIFFQLGLIIAGVGALGGSLMGLALVGAQAQWGLIGLGDGYLIEAYPVKLKVQDFVLVFFTVLALSSLASWLSARRLSTALLRSA